MRMRAFLRLALATNLTVLLSCAGDAADDGSSATGTDDDALAAEGAPICPPPTFDWKAGDYPPNLQSGNYLTLDGLPNQGNRKRSYKVHVPKGYDASKPAPVLFALHGLLQNPLLFPINGTSLVAKSDEEGFVLVMPMGLDGSWNGGICCGAASSQKIDDVGFIRALYAEVGKHVNIDAGRVYATGLSNGGFMSYRLACDASDLFVAVAPVAGAVGIPGLPSIGTNPTPDFTKCEPKQKVAVLAVHGDADPIVPFSGSKPSLDLWARANGCQEITRPAQQPASNAGATCSTYEGCEGVEVTGCAVAKGGHCWFGDPSCGTGAPGIGNLFVGNNSTAIDTTDAVWSFLSRFRR